MRDLYDPFDDYDFMAEEKELRKQPYTPDTEILNSGDIIIQRRGGYGVNDNYANVTIRKLIKDSDTFCREVWSGDGIVTFKTDPLDKKYNYYMVKGGAFSWAEVAPVVLRLIREYTGV